jgi:hypothetical protein
MARQVEEIKGVPLIGLPEDELTMPEDDLASQLVEGALALEDKDEADNDELTWRATIAGWWSGGLTSITILIVCLEVLLRGFHITLAR